VLRPVGIRPCCMTPVYEGLAPVHEADCPEWGSYRIVGHVLPDLFRDPWRGTEWSGG
jgi:hypothetical protein